MALDLMHPTVRAPRRGAPPPELWFAAYAAASGLGVWAFGGGAAALLDPATTAGSVGRVSGMLAAMAALAGLYLAARPRRLERRYGLDRLLGWHRLVGIATLALVALHGAADTIAWSAGSGRSIGAALVSFTAEQPWGAAAVAAAALLGLVGLSSWRRIKDRMPYETWYFLHLSGYLAVVLAFGHAVVLGSDLAGSSAMLAWWWTLSLGTAVAIVAARLADLGRAVRRPLRIVSTEPAADGAVALTVAGPRVPQARAGQFFGVRALTSALWWQSHPLSLSAAPDGRTLRFTVKSLGDGSTALAAVRPGTRVLLEGPYGVFTAAASHGRPVCLIAGGIGIAPIRAILQDCTPQQRPVVVLRAHRESEFAHLDEVARLVQQRHGTLFVLPGPRRGYAGGQPFSAQSLAAAVPDLAERDVFLCGPGSMEAAVLAALRTLHHPKSHIHRERFGV